MTKVWDAIATARDAESGELHATLFMTLCAPTPPLPGAPRAPATRC